MQRPGVPTGIVLAPMAGGVGTPQLVAAVSGAGGFGFLPSGYLDADRLRADVAAVRQLTGAGFGVNLFVPAGPDADRLERARRYAGRLAGWAERRGLTPGAPSYTDDDYPAKVDLLLEERPPVVSFAFGLPDTNVVEAFHRRSVAVLVTVTCPEEASAAAALGADGLVVQGWEAGAHQGGWTSGGERWALLALLQSVAAETDLPLVAAGGIATGAGVAAVLAAGASAAMLGTAFMRCPEAATSPIHAEALGRRTPTVMTRAFTGRAARALENELTRDLEDAATEAYPEVHVATGAMRAEARRRGDTGAVHLWAGQSHALARELPAAELVATLQREARAALHRAAARAGGIDG
jgi:nitronate monooxygenase